MIALEQVSMGFGHRVLFYDVNLLLSQGKKYALVGANGCGKSTFFRLLSGDEELSSGTISIPKDKSIGWLKQDQFRYENDKIIDVVLMGKKTFWLAWQAKERLLNQANWDDKTVLEFSRHEEAIINEDGYTATAKAEAILLGLGIKADYFHKPLHSLSGGYKLRVLLAQTLFQNPEILLLDEPTNHLDYASIQWLARFLADEFKGLIVFISHDLDFINQVADQILDLDYGEIREYPGQYHRFMKEKQLLESQRLAEIKTLEAKIETLQKFVDKYKAKASRAGQARARMKMIEKIEIPDIRRSSRIAPAFEFKTQGRLPKLILTVDSLAQGYQDRLLFENLSFQLHQADKIAIMGTNGIGKSTLIKTLIGELPAKMGQITWSQEVKISYFSQDHHENLNQSISIKNWLLEQVSGHSEQAVRKILGQMLFDKEAVDKDVLTLSGGEAARLLLAKIMMENPNVIVLDEPTNHMDLETIQSLATALAKFEGVVIFVSHNRYFVDIIANRILYFKSATEILDIHGCLSDYNL